MIVLRIWLSALTDLDTMIVGRSWGRRPGGRDFEAEGLGLASGFTVCGTRLHIGPLTTQRLAAQLLAVTSGWKWQADLWFASNLCHSQNSRLTLESQGHRRKQNPSSHTRNSFVLGVSGYGDKSKESPKQGHMDNTWLAHGIEKTHSKYA